MESNQDMVVRFEVDKGSAVAIITMDRPQVRNALDADSWAQLGDALARVATSESIRCAILTGSSGFFSSGGDVKSMDKSGKRLFDTTARLRLGHATIMALAALPKPIIAAVEGFAVGVGWSMALACDFIVADERAYFWAPFIERGLVPDGGIAHALAGRVGHQRAAEILVIAERISAADAMGMGLVNRLSRPGMALDDAMVLAETISRRPAETVRLVKMLLRQAARSDLTAFLEAEESLILANSHSADVEEGKSAFLEKRQPRFNRT